MKVVILAGGLGTRISEESQIRPKPMVEIGGKPILWHIMKHYSYYGFNEFIICCGYKGHMIKEYFADYYMYASDITFNFINHNELEIHNNVAEPWKVTLVDTGEKNMTGSRIKQIQKYIPEGEAFMLTYGDGVSDINLERLVKCHNENDKIVTVTAVQPGGRFGVMNFGENDQVIGFEEKPKDDGNWISGGFFVLKYDVFHYLKEDTNFIFEIDAMPKIALDRQMVAYRHRGFWQPMDTLRDKNLLESLWDKNEAPWKVW